MNDIERALKSEYENRFLDGGWGRGFGGASAFRQARGRSKRDLRGKRLAAGRGKGRPPITPRLSLRAPF